MPGNNEQCVDAATGKVWQLPSLYGHLKAESCPLIESSSWHIAFHQAYSCTAQRDQTHPDLGVGAPQSHLNIESFGEVKNSSLQTQMKLSKIVTALMTTYLLEKHYQKSHQRLKVW